MELTVLDDAKRSHAQLQEEKARAARERARAKARTPEARARRAAAKAAKKKAEMEYLSLEGQAAREAQHRDWFIQTRWQLVPVSESVEPHIRYLLEGSLVWNYQNPSYFQSAYVFPTALGWETSHHWTWREGSTVFGGVIHDTAEQAKGAIFEVYYGPPNYQPGR